MEMTNTQKDIKFWEDLNRTVAIRAEYGLIEGYEPVYSEEVKKALFVEYVNDIRRGIKDNGIANE